MSSAIAVTPRTVALIALVVVGIVQPWWNWVSLDWLDEVVWGFIAISLLLFLLPLVCMMHHLRRGQDVAISAISSRQKTCLVAWIVGAIVADMILPKGNFGDCILLLFMLGIWLFVAQKTAPLRPIYIAALGCGIVAELLLNAFAPVNGNLTNLMS